MLVSTIETEPVKIGNSIKTEKKFCFLLMAVFSEHLMRKKLKPLELIWKSGLIHSKSAVEVHRGKTTKIASLSKRSMDPAALHLTLVF